VVPAADKNLNDKVNLGPSFECHKPQPNQDFVHSYDKHKTATY
jgi:hypothetical protein